MNSGPLYSFVATSRNDDHGGDILRRTQSWITRLAQQANRHQVRCELILVDWNPPKNRAPLSDVLAWPRGTAWFSARVLTVPRRLHRELRFSSRLAMFQMIAKNVGIRRARGDFIIATNVDIIFSDEIFRWLKLGEATAGRLYRSDRWDIPNEIQLEPDLDLLLRRAREEAIRRNLRDGTYVRRGDGFVNSTPSQFDLTFYQPLQIQLAKLSSVVEQSHDAPALVTRELKSIFSKISEFRDNFFIPMLHTNGCGDFSLMAREDWFALRGYPEWQIFSWAIDSVIIFQAHYNGIRIEELAPDLVHYHIEHDYGSGWTPEGSNSLWARLEQHGIPYINYIGEIAKELQRHHAEAHFTVYNGLDWGFFGREIDCVDLVQQGTAYRPPVGINNGPAQEAVELATVTTIPLESIYLGEPLAKLQLCNTEDVPEISAETSPEQWSSCLAVDLTGMWELRECWLAIEIRVEAGLVYASLLNHERTDFLSQIACPRTGGGIQDVRIFVRDMRAVSNLVFRNGTEGGERARFRLTSIRILRETEPLQPGEASIGGEQVMLVARPESAAIGQPGGALASAGFRLEDIRAVSPQVLIRVLLDLHGVAPRGPCAQVLVVLPPDDSGPGALLDLNENSSLMQRLSIRVHVIEGEVQLGIVSQATGEMLAEHCEAVGGPLARVELDLPPVGEPGCLVIRNRSPQGSTRVLLHSIECKAAA